VEYKLPGSNASTDSIETKCACFLKTSLSSCLNLEEFPRQIIYVRVSVLRDEGSAVSVALNACTLALLDAGFPMTAIPVSVSCTITRSEEGRGEETLMFDPSRIEEDQSLAHFQFAFASVDTCSDTNSNLSDKLLAAECCGIFNTHQFLLAVQNTTKAAHIIKLFIRKILDDKAVYL